MLPFVTQAGQPATVERLVTLATPFAPGLVAQRTQIQYALAIGRMMEHVIVEILTHGIQATLEQAVEPHTLQVSAPAPS